MNSINRQVAIIKPKEPYVAWINSLADMDEQSTIDSLNDDCTALLLPHFDDDKESMKYTKNLQDNFRNGDRQLEHRP